MQLEGTYQSEVLRLDCQILSSFNLVSLISVPDIHLNGPCQFCSNKLNTQEILTPRGEFIFLLLLRKH